MLAVKLNRKLENQFNINQGFEHIVFDVITRADMEGWLRTLVEKAIVYQEEKKNNPHRLINFLQTYKDDLPPEGPKQDFSLLISRCNPEEPPDPLREALERQREIAINQGRMLPLVCIVHGDSEDLDNIIRERLAGIDLKDFLRKIDKLRQIENTKQIRLPLPESVKNLPKYFSRTLLEEFCQEYDGKNNRKNLRDAIRAALNYPEQLMLYYESDIVWDAGGEINVRRSKFSELISSLNFFSQSPEEKIQNKIKAVLEFWNNPYEFLKQTSKEKDDSADIQDDPFAVTESLPPNPLLIFLFYNYRHFAEPQKQDQRLNKKMYDFFSGLDFDRYPNICGVVLEQIQPVGEELVRNWLYRKKFFTNFCPAHPESFCNPSQLKIDVKNYYDDKTNEHILKGEVFGKVRMKFLTTFLNKKLNDYSCRERI